MKNRQTILQVSFNGLRYTEALDALLGFLQSNNNHMIATPNPEMVMLAKRDEGILHILQNADLVLADGIGITLAAKLLKLDIPERVPGCDVAIDLLKSSKGHSCYLLGAAPGVAEKARENLTKQGVNVVGHHDGFFDYEKEKIILEELLTLKPDILILGMGMQRELQWAAKHLCTLPCKVTMCLGGTIDIIAGNVRRAPKIIRKLGLEWLWRLLANPSRAKRMLDLPRFTWEILGLCEIFMCINMHM